LSQRKGGNEGKSGASHIDHYLPTWGKKGEGKKIPSLFWGKDNSQKKGKEGEFASKFPFSTRPKRRGEGTAGADSMQTKKRCQKRGTDFGKVFAG